MTDDEIRSWLLRAGYSGDRLEEKLKALRGDTQKSPTFTISEEQARQWKAEGKLGGTVGRLPDGRTYVTGRGPLSDDGPYSALDPGLIPGEREPQRAETIVGASSPAEQAAAERAWQEAERRVAKLRDEPAADRARRYAEMAALLGAPRECPPADSTATMAGERALVRGLSRPARWSWSWWTDLVEMVHYRLGTGEAPDRRIRWPPWASCAAGWAVMVGAVAGPLAILGPRETPLWFWLSLGAVAGFYGVHRGARLDALIRASGQESRPAVARADRSLSKGDCAVCETPVFESMPFWTKNPEKYPNARPVHSGDCFARWSD